MLCQLKQDPSFIFFIHLKSFHFLSPCLYGATRTSFSVSGPSSPTKISQILDRAHLESDDPKELDCMHSDILHLLHPYTHAIALVDQFERLSIWICSQSITFFRDFLLLLQSLTSRKLSVKERVALWLKPLTWELELTVQVPTVAAWLIPVLVWYCLQEFWFWVG